jgi:lipoate-protein ligase B
VLAAFGVAARDGVACHGAFINVNPAMRPFTSVDVLPPAAAAGAKTTMGCLLAERQAPVRMTGVRSALVEQLAAAFDSERYYLHTGHPWLAASKPTSCETTVCDV